jgi:hypothetical protein
MCPFLPLTPPQRAVVALAGPANKQGRVAGANAAGAEPLLSYSGALGTAIVGFRQHACGITGLSEERATALHIPHTTLFVTHNDHAGYYPGAHEMDLKVRHSLLPPFSLPIIRCSWLWMPRRKRFWVRRCLAPLEWTSAST